MTRKELYAKAVELRAKSGPVGAMVAAINEADLALKDALGYLNIFVATQQTSADANNFRAVNAEATIKYAIAYATAGAKLDTLFLTLAVLLEQMGIEVNY